MVMVSRISLLWKMVEIPLINPHMKDNCIYEGNYCRTDLSPFKWNDQIYWVIEVSQTLWSNRSLFIYISFVINFEKKWNNISEEVFSLDTFKTKYRNAKCFCEVVEMAWTSVHSSIPRSTYPENMKTKC